MLSKIILNNKNLQNNLNFVKNQSHNAKICAMVKANAYGHGLKEIVSMLSGKVEAFGVVNIDEAMKVREIDLTTPVIIFGECEDIHNAILNDISLSIISVDYLKKVIKSWKKLGKKPKLHLNVNSGMNRFGIKTLDEFNKVIKILQTNKLNLEGIFTHFSSLTTDDDYTKRQREVFEKFINHLPKTFKPLVHVGGGNSLFKVEGFDMYRVGMFLYGYGNQNLKPVLSVKSKIIAKQNVKKGEHVGYMSSFTADKDMQVAVVPLGYDDGVKRGLSNNFYVKIKGELCKNVGKICMDCFMVDVTNVKAKVGDEVEVLANASEWTETLNTTEYEILTNFNGFRGERVIKK